MEMQQILNGKVQLYRRGYGRIWRCAASVGDKQRRATTKRDSVSLATEFAEILGRQIGGFVGDRCPTNRSARDSGRRSGDFG